MPAYHNDEHEASGEGKGKEIENTAPVSNRCKKQVIRRIPWSGDTVGQAGVNAFLTFCSA